MTKLKKLSLLIKPASSGCNLRCSYCFYFDEAENREVPNYGGMTFETLDSLVKNAFQNTEESVNFMFQGGEPTLRGLEFFYKLHELVEKYNKKGLIVGFALQTNGTLIDENWISLFKKYNYLVGISLDGMRDVHDLFRVDTRGEGTFDLILENIYKLSVAGIDFNILTVVNSEVAKRGREIYEFFRDSGFSYMQFIPALDPLTNTEKKEFSLTAASYGKFLDEVFNSWYEDILSGKFTSIRYYENLLLILLGRSPEACDMVGHCTANAVVEADGSVYPCDFYVLDEKRLGNVKEDSFVELLYSSKAIRFVKESYRMHEKCKSCRYLRLCRSGCKRHKDEENYNKFCESYLYFFDRNFDKLLQLRDLLQRGF